ncbi:MAG: hypothetical protein QXH81_06665 [Thermofilaceae archaeon]
MSVRLAYVSVRESALKGVGRLVWYPFARLDPADEEGWCLLVDCFAAALAGSSTARPLLSRKLEVSGLELHSQPSIDAPMLEPIPCGREVLREIKALSGKPGGVLALFSPFEPRRLRGCQGARIKFGARHHTFVAIEMEPRLSRFCIATYRAPPFKNSRIL